MNPVTKFAAAALAAILLLITGACMDGPDAVQTAQAVADEADYAATVADGGRAKCAQLGRQPVWTPDGSLICRQPRPVIAQGAHP